MTSDELIKRFGLAVRNARKKLGISQEELAERAGLHRTYVTDIEGGYRNISLRSIELLASALGISLSALFDSLGDSSMIPSDAARIGDMEILLVDDNVLDVGATMKVFRTAGMQNGIRIASNVSAAREHLGLGSSSKESARPGLILVAANSPVFTGISWLSDIKKDLRTLAIPLIVLTNSAESRAVVEHYAFGPHVHLPKPLDFRRFCETAAVLGCRLALVADKVSNAARLELSPSLAFDPPSIAERQAPIHNITRRPLRTKILAA